MKQGFLIEIRLVALFNTRTPRDTWMCGSICHLKSLFLSRCLMFCGLISSMAPVDLFQGFRGDVKVHLQFWSEPFLLLSRALIDIV